ncbi:cupin domain-containing protein [Tomitella biformata]|uniref:cupin domain-containing protein n=1 Tax=Tomitella biformata TaxID=630403 RepID=UPI0004659BF4|nr:cupin domain-containing protein [Tomitella biformata]
MTLIFGDLVDDSDWVPIGLNVLPSYYWNDGGTLADSPVDFVATFSGNMFVTTKPIEMSRFNRNPLRVLPGFVVPRHHHNMDEMLFVLAGEYSIEYDEGDELRTAKVRPGEFFISRAGTAYTMTAGPEGVTYIETWPRSVTELETFWHDFGWTHRKEGQA